MNTTDLTFNDLPKVVGELCEKIAGMENLLRAGHMKLQKEQHM